MLLRRILIPIPMILLLFVILSTTTSSSGVVLGMNDDTKTIQEKYEAAFAKASTTTRRRQQSTSVMSGSSIEAMAVSTSSDGTVQSPPPQQTTTTTTKKLRALPYYISEDTIEAQRWRQEFEFRRVTLHHDDDDDYNDSNIDIDHMFPKLIQRNAKHGSSKNNNKVPKRTMGATNAHFIAARNDIKRMREIAITDPTSLDTPDTNGWLPMHEAARGGSTEVIRFLVEEWGHIANINARTNDGKGGTALWWAEYGLSPDHEVITILKRNGAVSIAPFQKKKKQASTRSKLIISRTVNKNHDVVDDEEEVEE